MNPFDKKELSTEVIDKSQVGLAIAKAGITGDRATRLRDLFLPFELQANEWKEKAYSLVVTDESQTDLMKQARQGRLSTREIRLAVEKQHKEGKADALKEGQLYDLIKRVLLGLLEPIEGHYEAQEKFAERQAEKRRMEAYNARVEALSKYIPVYEAKAMPLGDMTQDAFDNMLSGYHDAQEKRLRYEKEEAERRQAEDRKKAEEAERLHAENERLRKEQDEIRKKDITASKRASILIGCGATMEEGDHTILYKLQFEGFPAIYTNLADLRRMEDNEWQDLLKAAQQIQDAVWAENDAKRKKDEQAKARMDATLKKEREERQRLEREAQEKAEKEEADKKAKAAAERKAKRAPDRVKLLSFASQIGLLEPPTLKDEEAQKILNDVTGMLAKVVKYLNDQVEKKL